MKSLFVAAMIAAGSMFFAQVASAGYCNMATCGSTITVDSGYTGKNCTYSGVHCNCHDYAASLGLSARIQVSDPGALWENHGSILGSSSSCWMNDWAVAPSEDIQASNEATISDVFAPIQSTAYYGYVGATLRSPTSGRGNSAHAKLDACLFYSDVDNLGTGYTGWNTCKTSTTLGCNAANKNEYCMNNGASVCEDRCDCVFTGFASCEGL